MLMGRACKDGIAGKRGGGLGLPLKNEIKFSPMTVGTCEFVTLFPVLSVTRHALSYGSSV
jgi:hypothetical protein